MFGFYANNAHMFPEINPRWGPTLMTIHFSEVHGDASVPSAIPSHDLTAILTQKADTEVLIYQGKRDGCIVLMVSVHFQDIIAC